MTLFQRTTAILGLVCTQTASATVCSDIFSDRYISEKYINSFVQEIKSRADRPSLVNQNILAFFMAQVNRLSMNSIDQLMNSLEQEALSENIASARQYYIWLPKPEAQDRMIEITLGKRASELSVTEVDSLLSRMTNTEKRADLRHRFRPADKPKADEAAVVRFLSYLEIRATSRGGDLSPGETNKIILDFFKAHASELSIPSALRLIQSLKETSGSPSFTRQMAPFIRKDYAINQIIESLVTERMSGMEERTFKTLIALHTDPIRREVLTQEFQFLSSPQ